MIAALPMYDLPRMQPANDRYWSAIRDRLRAAGVAAPPALTRGDDLWDIWLDPGLVLAQTCGYPFRARLHGKVTLIGTPDFAVPGCAPGYYRSVFVVSADDPRSDLGAFAPARFAYNEPLSQSGWAAPRTHAQSLGITLTPALETGAHRLSALAVAQGRADIAAIDAVTWRFLQRDDPGMSALRVLAQTDPTPGLPYIAAAGADAAALFAAIDGAIRDLSPDDREVLGLRGLVAIPAAAYLAVPIPPAP